MSISNHILSDIIDIIRLRIRIRLKNENKYDIESVFDPFSSLLSTSTSSLPAGEGPTRGAEQVRDDETSVGPHASRGTGARADVLLRAARSPVRSPARRHRSLSGVSLAARARAAGSRGGADDGVPKRLDELS